MKRFSRVIFMLLVVCSIIAAAAVPASAMKAESGKRRMSNSEITELIQRLREHSSEIYAEELGKTHSLTKAAEDMAIAADELERLLSQRKSPVTGSRYSGITLSPEQKDLLACIIWAEARGESFEGQQAVAEVVFNRMIADNFPNTLRGVLYAENQFPTVKSVGIAEPNETQYKAIESALNGPYVLPVDVVFFAQFPINDNIWGEIGGHIFCYQWWWEADEK